MTADLPPIPDTAGWASRWRQLCTVAAIELRRMIGLGRTLPALALAALPVVATAADGLLADGDKTVAMAKAGYASTFSTLVLGAGVFFGCALLFTRLFRGEILSQSLHFYFLSPLRREILAAGKYAAGVLASWALFGGAAAFSFLAIYLPLGSAWLLDDFANGPALGELLAYVGTTMLGCVSYGALFLLFGTMFRNPILPVAALLGWEGLHFLLPAKMQLASVRFHLQALSPTSAADAAELFGVLAAPPATAVSIATLLTVAAVALLGTMARLRRLETA